jgi:transcription initiation factor TFIIIB Brf1 subunit/transcription initiation factor TFIIB
LFSEVREACSKLGLPRVACETALGLARSLKPRSRAALAAALYKAALAHAHPLYPREVAEAFEVEFGEVRSWFLRLAGAGGVRVRGQLDLSKAFLARILADVGAGVKPGVAALASEIACKALKPGRAVKPLQLAAVAAYVTCKLYNHHVSLEQIAGLTGVGEAALSKTARKMEVTVRVWL